ncbi:MAG: MotA/TolQ/ExbB proton channel family protein, partial [Deltaproteobacteria bacterium]|nr:MotA/TolQ/ExbB proton channel family protein [Deltaproteobacteria bacterium]
DGKYLIFRNGKLRELSRQPAGTYLGTVAPFERATGGMARLAIDPSRGSILEVLVETPNARERVEQGGIVGYAIIVLGTLAGILAITRWLIVSSAGRKVAAQKRSDEVQQGNPLGRVLSVYEENKATDVETLELKLDEVIMREASKLERLLWAVRVVSVVAPLMGLLGTVTGMIQTFQAITLFGTGDPKMMASGISEALVTTMLGLIVAIPLVLLHALVSNTSQGVVQILEEQAAGLIARRAEQIDAA